MDNIILGFNEDENKKMEMLLRQINCVVKNKYTTCNEILKMENNLYSPIIITKERLKDGSAKGLLTYTSKNCEHIIVSSKTQELDEFITKAIYINNVISKRQLYLAINMLSNINKLKTNNFKINKIDIDAYEKAKGVLMSNFNFSEELAHNFIQKRSMNMCVKKDLLSQCILNSV